MQHISGLYLHRTVTVCHTFDVRASKSRCTELSITSNNCLQHFMTNKNAATKNT